MRRVVFFTALSFAMTACSSEPATPPIPEDPTDAASIVAAARECHVGDYDGVASADLGEPEFHGEPSQADRNQLESTLYLEAKAEETCVYALPSGLLLRVLQASGDDMPSPTPGEMVTAHYEGSFPNGEVFDSSYERGAPITHSSTGFIPGWNEALSLMRIGEEWELFIPSNLAYGERGVGPIGPNMALMFRMELVCLPAREEPSCADIMAASDDS